MTGPLYVIKTSRGTYLKSTSFGVGVDENGKRKRGEWRRVDDTDTINQALLISDGEWDRFVIRAKAVGGKDWLERFEKVKVMEHGA